LTRYEAIAENPFEERLLSAPQAPRALFDTFVPLLQAGAIMAGLRLGVFEALRESAQGCEELARSLALDAEALEMTGRQAQRHRQRDQRGCKASRGPAYSRS
jgi:hypothetical protein